MMANINHKVKPSRNDDISSYRPFGPQWMDSVVQETLLPDAPWQEVQQKINEALAKRIEAEIYKGNNGEKREALYRVLGPQFVQNYLSKYPYDPEILSPTNIPLQQRRMFEQEMKSWLSEQLQEVVKEVGCERQRDGDYSQSASPEMKAFIDHTYQVINTALDRHLFLQEKKEELQSRVNTAEKEVGQMLNNLGNLGGIGPVNLPGGVTLPGMKPENQDDKSTATPGTVSFTRATKRRDRHVLSHNDVPPNSWSPGSETLGRALSAILRRDPHRLHEVCEKLSGKQLPGNLRQYLWTEVLFKSDKSLLSKEGNIEKLLRNRFAKKVSMGKIDLKLQKATTTPIHGLIWNAIVEMFNNVPSMQAYQKREAMKESANALNVLYTYNRSYEPYLIQWLFPIQLTYADRKATEEKPYELAMYLDLLMVNLFPKWPEVFAIAEKTMNRLKIQDIYLQDHLEDCALKNVDVDPKQFLVQLIHIEKDKALALGRATPGSEHSIKLSKELLADPVIFVRKWIGEGFVGVLDGQAVLFLWDQLFMNGWNQEIMEDFCFALLLLLKDAFLQANDYHQMKQVFLLQPARLYTADIQRAYQHLRKGGSPTDIPGMNRYRSPGLLFTPEGSREASAVPSPVPSGPKSKPPSRDIPKRFSPGALTDVEPGELRPIGLKKFRMTLVLLHQQGVSNTDERVSTPEQWRKDQLHALSYFDPNQLKVTVSVYFGMVRLQSIQSHSKAKTFTPKDDDVLIPKNNTNIVYVEFPQEETIFYNLDPSLFHGARGKRSHPFAVIKIAYQIPPGKSGQGQSIPLGWVRTPLYELKSGADTGRQSKISVTSTGTQIVKSPWVILVGDKRETLLPGPAVESALDQPKSFTDKDFLQEGSQLGFRVFDPQVERPTEQQPSPVAAPAEPETTQPPAASPRQPPPPQQQPKSASPSPSEDYLPRLEGDPWVRQKPNVAVLPPATEPKEGFDLYIDGVRYIPDNATIVKVTGRLMNSGLKGLEDIAAFPSTTSSARCPRMKYRYPVTQQVQDTSVIILRLYTVDTDTKKLEVIGSCMLQPFVKTRGQTKLNVGGIQLRIKSGLPDTSKPLTTQSMDPLPNIPGCSLLVRLLPKNEEFQEAPEYKIGYYNSTQCEPYASEVRILQHFVKDTKFPLTVTEAIHRLQIAEGAATPQTLVQDEAVLSDWLKDRLDKKHLPPKVPPKDLDLTRLVYYEMSRGINIHVQSAFGMDTEGLYCNAFVRVAPGGEAIDLERTEEGYGGEEKFLTKKHDYSSLQKSPRWLDMPTIIHPHMDVNSIILIQIFSLDAIYTPSPDGLNPGTITGPDGDEAKLGTDSQKGWAAAPLFNGPYVMQGVHHLPLFEGTPSSEFLQMALTTPLTDTFKSCLKDKTITLDKNYASLVVATWDGHYDKEETIPLPRIDEYLSVDKPDKFTKTANNKKGKLMSELVLKTMDAEAQKQGPGSEAYKREEENFHDAMSKTFYELMESALMNAGYGPL